MKRAYSASVLWTLVLASIASAQQSKSSIPWFDMKQCAFCKNMAPLESRMSEIACDTHKIDDGMLMVAYVPDDLKSALHSAHEKMMGTVKELESGKQLPMCGFCQKIGMFMAQGATMKKYQGDHGEVTLFTSDDPAVVKQLHEFADETIRETKAQRLRLSKKAS